MVQLAQGQVHRSRSPQVLVENPLKPGRYRFSLVVVDDARNESAPAELLLTVVEQPTRPTRPIERDELIDIDRLRVAERLRRPVVDPLRPTRPR